MFHLFDSADRYGYLGENLFYGHTPSIPPSDEIGFGQRIEINEKGVPPSDSETGDPIPASWGSIDHPVGSAQRHFHMRKKGKIEKRNEKID